MQNIIAPVPSQQSLSPPPPLLSELSNAALLSSTQKLVTEERRLTALVLSHLEEIERRRLHLETHSSLFDFCRRSLGYSESEAHARISAMRLSRELPEVVAAVEVGSLSLTNLVKAQTYFRQERKAGKTLTQAEKRDLLFELQGKSTRECERALAERSPQAAPPDRERVISPTHTLISFSADEKLQADLEKIRGLWGHQGRLGHAELFQKMADAVLKQINPARLPTKAIKSPGAPQVKGVKVKASLAHEQPTHEGATHEPVSREAPSCVAPSSSTSPLPPPPPELVTPKSRHIPVPVRRKVWIRDQGRCTHRYAGSEFGLGFKPNLNSSSRCESTYALEVDHVIPFAHGGTHELANLRLLCRAHHGTRTSSDSRTSTKSRAE